MAKRIEKSTAPKAAMPLATISSAGTSRGGDAALLTPEQFAASTGISVYTVRVWMRQDIISSLPVGVTGRVRRIPAGEVERIRGLHGNR